MDGNANLKAVGAAVSAGKLEAEIIRGSESWQFFAFVFAAATTVCLSVVDNALLIIFSNDSLRSARWALAVKPLVFFFFWWLLLGNSTVRNLLARCLDRFKRD